MFKLLFGLYRGTEKERVKEELFQLTIPKYFTYSQRNTVIKFLL